MVAGVLWQNNIREKGYILGSGSTVHHDREGLLAGRAPVYGSGSMRLPAHIRVSKGVESTGPNWGLTKTYRACVPSG